MRDPKKLSRSFPSRNVVEVVSVQESGTEAEDSSEADDSAENFDELEEESDEDFDEFEEEFGEEAGVQKEVFDPLMTVNRGIYHFNDFFYRWAWRPVAVGYAWVVPEQARIAIALAYNNFRTPPQFGNALLQLKFKKAGLELGRLMVNSTIGVGGLFDPADYFLGWRDPSEEDFGQTLAYWGLGEGFPIVLPLLGPSNVRDGLGMVPDAFSHPVVYLGFSEISPSRQICARRSLRPGGPGTAGEPGRRGRRRGFFEFCTLPEKTRTSVLPHF